MISWLDCSGNVSHATISLLRRNALCWIALNLPTRTLHHLGVGLVEIRLPISDRKILILAIQGFRDFRPGYTILDAWTTPSAFNPFGEVSNGHLRISGSVCSLPSSLSLMEEDKGMIQKRWRASVRGQCIAYCSLDWTLRPRVNVKMVF
jgi:hypothetical protein